VPGTDSPAPIRRFSLSLTATLQMIGNLWLANVVQDWGHRVRELLRTHQWTLQVGNRSGRNEPRVNKRRPKVLKLMTKPRRTTADRAAV